MSIALARIDYEALDEAGLANLARRGDGGAFRAVMRRCNERLFRIARGVVTDDAEAEDVLQEAYLKAFVALPGFRGEAKLTTWLTAIVINEARGRLRKRPRLVDITAVDEARLAPALSAPDAGPEAETARAEVRRLIERAIDGLPADFRLVFMMRDVEGCSTAETAASLAIEPGTVRSRLHRARAALRRSLDATLSGALTGAFPFGGVRCNRITDTVMRRLGLA